VYETKIGAGVKPFRAIFNEWASVLAFHALMEDEYVTTLLSESAQARDNKESHRRLEKSMEDVEVDAGLPRM